MHALPVSPTGTAAIFWHLPFTAFVTDKHHRCAKSQLSRCSW